MGKLINIETAGAQPITAYLAKPSGEPAGGIVVVQEIFGVNAHIREVAEGFAAQGYTAIAPVFFDHVQSGVEPAYDQAGFARGRALAGKISMEQAVADVSSAAQAIAAAGRMGVVGYCWGGTVAFLAGLRLGLPAVSYYGSRNLKHFGEPATAPLMFHFGERDKSLPPEAIERHRREFPQAQIFTYPHAGHGFSCSLRDSFDPAASRLAGERTAAFFAQHLRA